MLLQKVMSAKRASSHVLGLREASVITGLSVGDPHLGPRCSPCQTGSLGRMDPAGHFAILLPPLKSLTRSFNYNIKLPGHWS